MESNNIKTKNKIIFNTLLISIVLVSVFGMVTICFAEGNFLGAGNIIEGALLKVLAGIAILLVKLCGWVISMTIGAILSIASYNDFISEPDIVTAWGIVRDLCNMFFVLILLVIAFATILKYENYHLKKLLPKLLIMAVLINFSKMICGVLIDFSQIIMLTFVNAFSDGGGNFIASLQVEKFLSVSTDFEGKWLAEEDLNATNTLGAIFIAIIVMIISAITMLAILITFLMRMIMFWIYIVLSPLAFLLSAFPAGQKYSSQYWGEFTKYLVNGPVLAFFVWLALITLQNFDTSKLKTVMSTCTTEIMCLPNFIGFIIAIGFLVGGLIVSQQIGGIGASWGANTVKGLGSKGLTWAKKGALLPAVGGKALASFGIDKLHEKTGVDLNVARAWQGIKEKRAEKRSERYSAGMVAARRAVEEKGSLHGVLAMTGTPGSAWEQITSMKGFKLPGAMQRLRGGKYMAKQRERITGYGEGELKDLENIRSHVWTEEDKNKRIEDLDVEQRKYEDLTGEMNEKALDIKTAPSADKARVQAELSELNLKKKRIKDRMSKMSDEITGKTKKVVSSDEIIKVNDRIKKKKEELPKYIPAYDFEARAAEQKVVSEKTAKIKDVTDAQELFRILQSAIEEKDKAMIKAITKKMTQNYDDNEFLMPLVGHTGSEGLQVFMRALSGDKELYKQNPELEQLNAGFGEQEAFSLGSEITLINKQGTHHWANVGAYRMENGSWREADKKEQLEFRNVEVGKLSQQDILRKLNRLAYGWHDKTGEFHLDVGGIMLLQKLDNDGARKAISYNMNESAAQHVAPYLDGLVEGNKISKELADVIKQRNASIPPKEDFERRYQDTVSDVRQYDYN